MIPRRIELFTFLGVTIWADASWLPLALVLTWGFADTIYPSLVPELSRQSYWWMAVAGTIGLFFSIMFRELIQILVANRLKMPIGGITLFVFGGTFETPPAPTSGKVEF